MGEARDAAHHPAGTTENCMSQDVLVPHWETGPDRHLFRKGPQKTNIWSFSLYSSEQSAKANTHKELIRTLKELKFHLPTDKKAKGKASTLATLKYALRSVKQVKGMPASCVFSQPVEVSFQSSKLQCRLCWLSELNPDTEERNLRLLWSCHNWKPQFTGSCLLH